MAHPNVCSFLILNTYFNNAVIPLILFYGYKVFKIHSFWSFLKILPLNLQKTSFCHKIYVAYVSYCDSYSLWNAFELFLLYLHYPFPPLFRLSLLPFLLFMTPYFHSTSFWILFIAYYFDFFKIWWSRGFGWHISSG